MSEISPLPDHLSLPESVLARRSMLPLKPAPVELTGRRVLLRPLDLDRDTGALHRVSCGAAFVHAGRACPAYDPDALIWRFMNAGPFASEDALREYLRGQVDSPTGLAFAVIDRRAGDPVGVANYLANTPEHLKIELGSIWYSPAAQGTGANTEATLLMLAHAFALGYQRVEWKCNALNERSRRAALRMGFRFEGIQDAHYIVKGRRRDTAWFRMLADEWPAAKGILETLLEGLD